MPVQQRHRRQVATLAFDIYSTRSQSKDFGPICLNTGDTVLVRKQHGTGNAMDNILVTGLDKFTETGPEDGPDITIVIVRGKRLFDKDQIIQLAGQESYTDHRNSAAVFRLPADKEVFIEETERFWYGQDCKGNGYLVLDAAGFMHTVIRPLRKRYGSAEAAAMATRPVDIRYCYATLRGATLTQTSFAFEFSPHSYRGSLLPTNNMVSPDSSCAMQRSAEVVPYLMLSHTCRRPPQQASSCSALRSPSTAPASLHAGACCQVPK
jgi:hypothetical protein